MDNSVVLMLFRRNYKGNFSVVMQPFLLSGIDAEEARKEEEEMMLRDANQWLNSKTLQDVPHPKTGATALHIAAAKGYIKVLKYVLLRWYFQPQCCRFALLAISLWK